MIRKILSKVPFYRQYQEAHLDRQSKFYEQNRINVIDTYRHLLKMIPKIYPRPLQQAHKLNEIRWIFKQSKTLPNIYEVEGRTKLAMQILQEIKRFGAQLLAEGQLCQPSPLLYVEPRLPEVLDSRPPLLIFTSLKHQYYSSDFFYWGRGASGCSYYLRSLRLGAPSLFCSSFPPQFLLQRSLLQLRPAPLSYLSFRSQRLYPPYLLQLPPSLLQPPPSRLRSYDLPQQPPRLLSQLRFLKSSRFWLPSLPRPFYRPQAQPGSMSTRIIFSLSLVCEMYQTAS